MLVVVTLIVGDVLCLIAVCCAADLRNRTLTRGVMPVCLWVMPVRLCWAGQGQDAPGGGQVTADDE